MIVDIILASLAIIVLLIASIFDIKTKEVPDNLSIGFVIVALIIRLVYSLISSNYNYFLYGLLGFGIMFVIGLILYRTKQWGGADAKLLMGLGATFATQPYFSQFELPFLLIVVIMIILIGGIYNLAFAITHYFSHRKKLKPHFIKNIKQSKTKIKLFYLLAIVFIIGSLFMFSFEIKLMLMILGLFLIIYIYLSLFVKTIEKKAFIKQVALSKVTEGDWLAKDVLVKNKVLISTKHPCLLNKDLLSMKKHKIKKVWIKIGIPFVPAMALATILTILLSLKGF